MAAFDTDTAVVGLGGGRYRGSVNPRWNIGTAPNGGYVLAIALAALAEELHGRRPLSVTAHYLSPCAEGEVEVEVDVIKRGRSLTTASVRLVQDDRTRLAALATCGDLADQQGPTYITATAPRLPDPDHCEDRRASRTGAFIPIFEVIEFRPAPASGGLRSDERGQPAEIEGWLRFADGREPDLDSLPMLCDAMPPAIFAAIEPGWVPTLELTVHVRAVPTPGWLRARARTRVLIDGLLEEDCELWDSEGHLVAMSRQLARALQTPL